MYGYGTDEEGWRCNRAFVDNCLCTTLTLGFLKLRLFRRHGTLIDEPVR